MAGITCEAAQANLDKWLAASAAVSGGQSFSFESGGVKRSLTQSDAGHVLRMIEFWDGKVRTLCGTRGRTVYVVPE